jgi:hypothetical protein
MGTTSTQIYTYAVEAGAKWPGLVVAQWALESNYGKHVSGKNNIFGLKGVGTTVQTKEYVNGKPVTIRDAFLDFNTPRDAVEYLVTRWYKDFRGYKGVNNAGTQEAAAKQLQSEGYATDPRYAEKLIRIMSTNSKPNDFANLVDAVEHWKGLEHQRRAFQRLQATLTDAQRQEFTNIWRSNSATVVSKFPFKNVPYHAQTDSVTNQGLRMCQSSSIAMRIEQINPDLIKGDDDYLKLVNRYGDTVSQSAHQRALDHLGLKATFRQNGTEKMLCDLLDAGIAVPIGVLHRGNVSSPTGGGHWVTLVGYDTTHFWVNDPMGEMDLVNGGYVSMRLGSGHNVRYARRNLMRRWLIASQSDGWLWEIR